MTTVRRRATLPCVRRLGLLLPSVALIGCQSATEARVRLHTDVEHTAGLRVAMWAGGTTEAQGPAVVSTEGPWSRDGVIGSIHLVPRDDNRESSVSLRAVLAVDGQDPATCSAGNPRCIVSTRRLRYLKHKRLTVPVGIYRRCLGAVCGPDTTCNAQGACVPDAVDPDACVADDGCVLPGDPPTPPGIVAGGIDGGSDGPAPEVPIAPVPQPSFLDLDPRRGIVTGAMDLGAPEVLPRGGTLVARELRWTGAEPTTQPVRVPPLQRTYAFLGDYRPPQGSEVLEVRNVVVDAQGIEVVSQPALLRGDNYVRRLDIAAGTGADSIAQAVPLLVNSKLMVLTRAPDNRVSVRLCTNAGTQCVGKALPVDVLLAHISADVDPQDTSRGLLLAGTDPRTGLIAAVRCDLEATSCTAATFPTKPAQTGPAIARIDRATHDSVIVYGRQTPSALSFTGARCPSSGAACSEIPSALVSPDSEGGGNILVDDVVTQPQGSLRVVGRASFLASAEQVFKSTCTATACTSALESPISEGGSQYFGSTTLYDAPRDEVISISRKDAGDQLFLRRCVNVVGQPLLACTDGIKFAQFPGLLSATASFVGPPNGTAARAVAVLANTTGPWRLLLCDDSGCDGRKLDEALGPSAIGEGGLVAGGTVAAPEVRIVAPNIDLGGAPSHVRLDDNLKVQSLSTVTGVSNLAGSVRQDVDGESRMGVAYDADGRIVVTATNPTIGDRVSVFRCDREGAQCSHFPVQSTESSGRSNSVGFAGLPLFDAKSNRFVVLTADRRSGASGDRSGRPSAFFCDGRLETCSFLDVVLGRTASTWSAPQGALMDLGPSRGIRIVSAGHEFDKGGNLVRVASCELNGGDCGLDARTWGIGTVAAVTTDGSILIQRSPPQGLERCSFETTSCTSLGEAPRDSVLASTIVRYAPTTSGAMTLAVGRAVGSTTRISVVLGKLPGPTVAGRASFAAPVGAIKVGLVFDQARDRAYALVGTNAAAQLLRCNVTTASCDVLLEGAGLLRAEPSLSLRPDGKRLFVAIGDDANNGRPSLLAFDL
jgi:hypothetical protein